MDLKFNNKYSRKFLLFCAIWAGLWVCFSYCFLQNFLFMYPEIFSARLRFDLCVLALGVIFVAFSKDSLSTICGYFLWFYGALGGLICAKSLSYLHKAVRASSDMDGVMNCAGANKFLSFDLNKISLFKSYNSCTFDIPTPPANFEISGMRANLISAYNDGWYLFVSSKSLSLPTLWFIVFGFFAFVCVLGVILGFIRRRG
ncbi:hypothetical protein OFO03_02690 [Campylobacter sp. JMF_02 ED1]|uniref:hypothetical protein n=1 Tax=unclassified Campylobacter TaxID=2593542 RepID=UPI0022EA0CEA|nr:MULTISPECIES: hypothetical protein [unclassified Campylobacter]MDA3049858.1 hypothetical protein [Campylobacter sp. JMF_15 NE4]MDA3050816.1 hypothetical protein [Campylobacter sp. JMF_02 ED1]